MPRSWPTDPTPGENIDPEDQRAGELGVGHIAFGGLPYNLTNEEAEEMAADLKAREARRIRPGFSA